MVQRVDEVDVARVACGAAGGQDREVQRALQASSIRCISKLNIVQCMHNRCIRPHDHPLRPQHCSHIHSLMQKECEEECSQCAFTRQTQITAISIR